MANLVRIVRDHNEASEVCIFWREKHGEYQAYRSFMGAGSHARLPELDTLNLLDVMKCMRDFLAGTMDEEYYTPGETD
jgi:hypothetical protein